MLQRGGRAGFLVASARSPSPRQQLLLHHPSSTATLRSEDHPQQREGLADARRS